MLQPLLKTYVDLCESCGWFTPLQFSFLENLKFFFEKFEFEACKQGSLNLDRTASRSDSCVCTDASRLGRHAADGVPPPHRRPDPPLSYRTPEAPTSSSARRPSKNPSGETQHRALHHTPTPGRTPHRHCTRHRTCRPVLPLNSPPLLSGEAHTPPRALAHL
jgi:hypothetical protein